MDWGWKRLPKLGLVFVIAVTLGGCNRSAGVDAASMTTAEAAEAAAPEVTDVGGFRSIVMVPARTARLSSQAAGAQINLRSQPTTQSESQGYGVSGDAVTLLRLAEGEGGFSWYYINFAESAAEGWVRGDFIDHSNSVAIAPPTAAPGPETSTETSREAPTATPVATSTHPCGGHNRSEAFFETKSFTVHLCQTPQGLKYIGTNRGTEDTLATLDVRQIQGTYIAIDGGYQYHLNDRSLVKYQVKNGSYTQLKQEAILRHEQFLY